MFDDYMHPRVDVADTAPPPASAIAPPRAAVNGSIYQAGSFRPMFEDFRARLVGDTLTIQIVENISATATSTSSVAKTGTLGASVSALPILGTSALGRATASGTSNNTFSGQGATVNSNAFTGTITVIVRQVLPNGNLLIAGEKQIGVNENVDMLRFSGQVDPRAIQQGNTVPSSSVANVRLEQRGRGQQADSQAMGWLARVFQSVAPV
ncbi:MAG: flagellar basal body L-ring protein FlgH [Burkholderiales bacterium]|nr:flagellar basal body L-ring protein FlgH [Burkholderiales bacterium]MDE1929743.1 flagellar basal body L-ring protein FlgH [Burkholderiales bacterium]MDE2504613.1 flagellar basal body L-ring protein FlgH [Burkholderiales bacterium]